ncbi:MAG: SH3 domain-containing protein [Kiritimatiellae bacterium]|nr:SH3 domain-containing protein [Kiritimatiellia bacterium]
MSHVAVFLLLLLLAVPGYGETTPVRVLSDRVNMRAAPQLTAEVVTQVNEGELLSAKSFTEEWVEVDAPSNVDCWIHREFCVDGRVSVKKLNVRSGPGINYKIMGDLSRHDAVEVRGEFGEWIKIAPPAGSSVWISREYVAPVGPGGRDSMGGGLEVHEAYRRPAEMVSRSDPGVGVQPFVAEPLPPRVEPEEGERVMRVREKPKVQRSVPLPPDWKLIPLEGQGKTVEHEGMLKTVGFMIRRPTRYRLVQYDHGRTEMLCYVWGNDAQLDGYLGQNLQLKGRQYWVHGYRSPILVVEQVTLTSDVVPRSDTQTEAEVDPYSTEVDVIESTPYQPYN